jgi:hypothetical protein
MPRQVLFRRWRAPVSTANPHTPRILLQGLIYRRLLYVYLCAVGLDQFSGQKLYEVGAVHWASHEAACGFGSSICFEQSLQTVLPDTVDSDIVLYRKCVPLARVHAVPQQHKPIRSGKQSYDSLLTEFTGDMRMCCRSTWHMALRAVLLT